MGNKREGCLMKNEDPLFNISDNILNLDNFELIDKFKKICQLKVDLKNEKLVFEKEEIYLYKEGLVYLFIIDNNIIKIGSTIKSIKDRLISYNSGKKSYRKSGTCSTTNYFVLQTLINLNKNIDVYALFMDNIKIDVFGEIKK